MDISLRRPAVAAELTDLIRQASNAKQRDRYRAVELAIAGETTPTIMRMLGRSRGFVQRWCYAYRDGGLEAVRAQSPPGRAAKMTEAQQQAFKQRVLAGPTEADGVCTLRGRDFIRILQEEFGVSYKLSGVYDLLHRLELSVLCPRPQHRQSDPHAARQWEENAPLLSVKYKPNTRTRRSPSGSRTKRGSANKAR